jgi:hypothetical protein
MMSNTNDVRNDDFVITAARKEIVFIEDNVPDMTTLIGGIGAGKEVVILDSTRDGLQQIADALAGRDGIDALHVIAHGAAGSVALGTLLLDADNLGAHGAQLQTIKQSMAVGGDIMLYGCDVGAGSTGLSFVDQLALATGADVAASSNLTGAAALGGDWNLEVSSGQIETQAVVDSSLAALYQQTLKIGSADVNFEDGYFLSKGGKIGAQDDVIYGLKDDNNYLLKINGETKNVASYYDNGYIASDTLDNSDGEAMLTFYFMGGQVFSPTSIDVSNYKMDMTQSLVFKGYNAAGDLVGTSKGTVTGYATYASISLTGLTNIATLKLTADPASNGGKLFYLTLDNFQITDIHPAVVAPAVTSVSSSTSDGFYKAGATIYVTVTFDRAVDVDLTNGSPTLQLETGSTDQKAVYNGGTGTNQLTFAYKVLAGDNSPDLQYLGTAALALDGSTIKAKDDGTDAALALPALDSGNSLAAGKAIVVDTTAPGAPGQPVLAAASDTGTLGDNTTNKAKPTITGSGAEPGSTVMLYNGSVQIGTGTAGADGSWSITPFSSISDGTRTLTVKAMDAAGNVGGASQPLTITVDTTQPTLSITSSKSTLHSGDAATITFTFSEDPGATFTYDDVVVSGGTLGPMNESSGLTRTATFTPAPDFDGNASITVAVGKYMDTAGNIGRAGLTPSIAVHTMAPDAPAVPDLAAASDSGNPGIANWNTDNITNVTLPTFGGAADSAAAGATVKVYDGATLIATTTALGNGSWSVASSVALAEGQHTITATATDAGGNASAASGALTLTIDLTPPRVPAAPDLAATSDSGRDATDNVTKVAAPTFGGAAGSVDGGVTVKLNDTNGGEIASTVANGDGSWSVASITLAEGEHAITAKAIDAAGNTSAASGTLALTIDLTPPAAQALGAAFSNDSGSSTTDLVTRSADQIITGTLSAALAADERVEVSLDNGNSWRSAGVDGTGWSLLATLGGSDTLQVRVIDAAGNAGTAYTKAYVLDTAAPAAPSTPDLDAASDTGTFGDDDITGATRPTFSGSAEAGATVTLYDGDTAIGSGIAAGGTWHITSDTALQQGSHDITARATDLAGNQGAASAALTIQVITDAPTTKATGLAFSADSGASATDLVTKIAAQTLSGTLDAALASGEYVEVSINGGAWQTASADGTDWSLAATLDAGTHPIAVRVSNAIGNSGAAYTHDYTLDTGAPGVSISSDVAQLKAGETATITFTFSEDPGATFTWNGSAGDVVVRGGTLSAISGTGPVRTATFTPDAATDDGSASITIEAGAYADLAGNFGGAGATPLLQFDTLAPGAPSAPTLAAGSDSGVSGTDNLTANDKPTFTGTAASGSSVTLYDTNGAAIGSGIVVDGAWSIAPTAALADGAHTITAKALDGAGNASAASGALTVTIDKTAPALAITSDVASLKIGDTAIITFTFSEDPGASFMRSDVSVEGGTIGALSGTGLTRMAVFTPSDGVDGGTASITVNGGAYTDAAGNAGGAGATPVLRFDTRAPSAPSTPDLDDASDTGASNSDDISADTTPTFSGSAEDGARVTLYDGATATAIGSATAVDGKWQITSEVALQKGSHAITAVALDAAGNAGPASGALTIQLLTDGPATTVSGVALSSDSGSAGTDFVTRVAEQTISGTLSAALAAGEHVEVSIDGGQNWVTAAAAPGGADWTLSTVLVAGTHDLQVKVLDAVGNSGPVLARAYTLDTVAPGVTIESSVAQLKAGQSATITFTFSEDPGNTFTWDGSAGDVVVRGGTLSALSGSGAVRSATFTPDATTNGGSASITIEAGAYADLAGNAGGAGATPSLQFDTLVPAAPSAPVLAAGSDTGTAGDGVTTSTSQVIQGQGDAFALVALYDGERKIDTVTADADGKWSIGASLATGSHALSVTQADAAGNVSAHSASFALTVEAAANPAPTPTPTTLIDGMPVQTQAVTLPGGVAGSAISVPVVTGSRGETTGAAGVADIPLATSGGANLLLAQLPVGYGLSASGANVGVASGLEFLIASIKAATPTHAAGDQQHLTGNGQSFLAQLAASDSLLVQTVKPVSTAAPDGALVLSGQGAAPGQNVALVIDTSGLAAGSKLLLQQVDFAAVVGAADVTVGSAGTILSGDAASQHFTVTAGSAGALFAGGGNDILSFAQPQAAQSGSAAGHASAKAVPASGASVLHGGLAVDTATFSGARADYTVEQHNGYTVVSNLATPAASALVVNVEQLQFSDGSVAVEQSTGQDIIAGMYQTVLGRQADLYGFEYWADLHDGGESWGAIALHMIDSAEHKAGAADAGVTFNGNNAHDIALLYQALFNRAPESAGLAYWQDQMAHGATLAQVASGIVGSAEMVGHQRVATDWDFLV